MLLAQIEPPSPFVQGDQILRTHQPACALAEAHPDLLVVAGTWLTPLMHEVAEWADVLVVAQAAWSDFIPLFARRRAAGLATVVEINDNFLALHPQAAQGFWADSANQALVMQLAAAADGLVLSSAGLVERFAWLHPSAELLPNQLAQVPPFREEDWRRPGPLVVGWAGSGGHREDVRAAARALREVHDACPGVEVHIMSQPDILALFDDWPPARLRRAPAGGYRDYLRFLDGLHVGCAPLGATEFNLCRSDVKVIEYAAHSVVPVVEDATPYQAAVVDGVDGVRVVGPAGLAAALFSLAGDRAAAERLARAAHRRVAAERLEAGHATRRWGVMAQALARARQRATGAPAPGAPGPAPASAARARAQLMDAFSRLPTPAERPHPRFWQLHFDDAEAALVAILNAEDAATAGAALVDLGARHLRHPVVQLLAGRHEPDLARALEILGEVERAQPGGCEAACSAGHRLRAADQGEAALGAYGRAHARAPAWSLPLEIGAHLHLAAGDSDRALADLGAAVGACPFHRRPALTLAELAWRLGRPAAALPLLGDRHRVPARIDADEARLVGTLALLAGAPEALPYLAWAQARHPEDAGLAALRARTLAMRGRSAAARRLLAAARPRGARAPL